MERSDTIRKHKQQHKPNYYPSGMQRMDKELLSELKLYISLGYSVEQACQRFTVSQAMVEYAIKCGQEFNNLYKEDYKHEKK